MFAVLNNLHGIELGDNKIKTFNLPKLKIITIQSNKLKKIAK